MPASDPFRVFTDRLEQAGVPYMVTGSVASMIYGEPRLTHDIDVVIELARGEARRIVSAFDEREFYVPPLEAIEVEAGRSARGRFNLIHYDSGYKADVYVVGRDPLHLWAMGRRLRIDLGGSPLWLAPPEYVIVRKLEYFREGGAEKHVRDIAAMLDVSGDRIDLAAVEEEVSERGLVAEWRAARALCERDA